MLDRITIRNFKRFDEVEVELGDVVVLVGPNNSGKTSTLQALALWELGLRRWNEKRGGKEAPAKRSGVVINRRDLVSLPIPDAGHLWRGLHVRETERANGRQSTQNVRIEIVVDGVSANQKWSCGFEFDYANSESVYCRPLGVRDGTTRPSEAVPDAALEVQVAYLPPMSGLAANETRLDPGAVQVRLGEGRTAEVLRNLCYSLYGTSSERMEWSSLVQQVDGLFGITIDEPVYVPERGEIVMTYREHDGPRLDLSAAGRGLQQTLLLLAFIYLNADAVILVDEPDAHLEILRQRQIYQVVADLAREHRCQLIAASHSEVLLNEAADRDVVVAFVGRPHRIDDRGTQVLKSLRSIGFESYYQAEQKGWVLYLEGATDLAILRAFARLLGHPALTQLERPFVHYVENQPRKAEEHFFGLREAKPDLVGLAVLDRLERPVEGSRALGICCWKRREIESYLCYPEVLEEYAEHYARAQAPGPLFEAQERQRMSELMRRCIEDQIPPAAYRERDHAWWHDVKASDSFLTPVFEQFFAGLGVPNLLRKTDFHVLARFVPRELIAHEVHEKLDLILEVAGRALPTEG